MLLEIKDLKIHLDVRDLLDHVVVWSLLLYTVANDATDISLGGISEAGDIM